MPPSQTDWLPAIVMLLSCGVIGAAFAVASRRQARASASAARPLELRELLAARDSLIGRLREIEDAASTRTAEQLASERHEAEIEAAIVLRATEGEARHQALVPAEVAGTSASHHGLSGAVGGAALVGAIGALLSFAHSTATDRSPALITAQSGALSRTPVDQGMPHPDVATLEARVKQSANDFDARLALARLYLAQNNLLGTYEQTQYVLDRQPENSVAMAYGAIVRLAVGASDDALNMLNKAIALNPGLVDAWSHKAIALASKGRKSEAGQVIQEAEQRFPESRDALRALLSQLGSNETFPTEVAGSRAASSRVGGIIALDPSAASKVQYPAIVFIIARPEGVTAGGPSAVLRLSVTSFPIAFSLGRENSMIGGTLPPKVRIEALIDPDGNATTREPDARRGFVDHVPLGSNELQILVK